MWRVNFGQFQHDPRFGPLLSRVPRRPSWVWTTALTLGVLVVVIPLILLIVAGLAVGFVTFVVLSLVDRGVNTVQSIFGRSETPRSDGRRNVRVID